MLTVLRLFIPRLQEQHYAVMVEWCVAQSRYYSDIDVEKAVYWTKMAYKYLLKRLETIGKLL